MQEINGLKLLELLNEAKNQGVGFKVSEQSVQGLRGIYVEFDKMVRYDDDLFNIALKKNYRISKHKNNPTAQKSVLSWVVGILLFIFLYRQRYTSG